MEEPHGMPDPTASFGELPPEPGAPPPQAPAPGGPPPAEPVEPPPAAPAVEEYTEAQRIKELGLGDHADFAAAISAREQHYVSTIKKGFEQAGLFLQGNTPEEIAMEVDFYAKQAAAEAAAAAGRDTSGKFVKAAPTTSVDLEAIYKEVAGDVEIDEPMKKLLGTLTEKILEASTGLSAEAQSRQQAKYDEMQDRIWLSEAKATAGEGPVPSAAEALKMLNANPKLREAALYRQRLFGDESANPMSEIISMYRAEKTGTGGTNATEAKANAEAEKVARFKRSLTPGAVAASPAKKPSDLSNEQLHEGIMNIPISEAFAGRR